MVWPLVALCAPLLAGADAAAQDDGDAAETAAARALAVEGIKLADAGHCDDAIEKLAKAEKLHHAPVVLGRLGECQILQGKLVEGTETLRKVLREPLAPDAPAVVVRARERASAVFERSKLRIAGLNITVKGPHGSSEVAVSVDGQPMNSALLDAERPTDPGEHLVEASAPGFTSAAARVSVAPGERQSLVLTLEPDPRARAAAAATASEPAPAAAENPGLFTRVSPLAEPGAEPPSSSAPPAELDLTKAYIAWGAGGAAVIAGSVFGLLAFQGKSDLDKQCPQNVCPDSSADKLSSARTDSTVATVLMAVGGAGIALGTVFYFTAGPREESAPATAEHRPEDGLRARAWIGLGGVGIDGRF
ncbi:MAG TPA: hypothetical protein VFS67_27190 [Polyangiaceae bacterium]|nr:hypothetical protein [Polyangiaceae bacterium]